MLDWLVSLLGLQNIRDYMLILNKNKQQLLRWGCGGETSGVGHYVVGETSFCWRMSW